MADQSIPTIQQKGVNVGIGTGNPLTQLHVNDGVNVSNLTMLTLSQLGNTGNRDVVNLKMSFNNGNTPGTMISAVKTAAAGSDMTFSTGAISNGALSEKMRITSAGNVGIGDNGPSSKLQVAGDVRISGAGTGIDGYDGGFLDYASSTFRIRGQNTTGGAISLMTSANGASNVSTERVRITSGGFVGINESSPAYRLQVTDSNQYVAGFINNVADQLLTVTVQNSAQSTAGVNTAAATFELVGKAGTSPHGRHAWIGAEGVAAETFRTKLLFKIRGESNSGYTWSGVTAAPTIVTMDGNGQVSFNQYTSASSFTGTAAGVLAFDSSGNIITQSATLYPSGSGTTNYVTKWTGTNSLGNSLIFDNGSNVFIGATSNAFGLLDLTVSPSSYTAALGLGNITPASEGQSTGISFKHRIALDNNVREGARIAAISELVTASAYQSLAFYTMNTTTLAERMRILYNGNVGIGTISPAATLQVAAASSPTIALNVTGSITSGIRGDIAWYNSAISTVASIRATAITDNVGTQLEFYTRPAAGSLTQRMILDASGNLGLGQAPNSTWIANSKAIQIKDWTSLSQRTDGAAVFGMNIVETSSNSYSYLQSFSAGRYQINGNEHTWYNAPSGTAGNAISFTQAMTLDASGRLAVGTSTFPTQNIGSLAGTAIFNGIVRISGSSNRYFTTGNGLELAVGSIYSYNRDLGAYNDLGINDAMTVKGAGNVGIGTSNPALILEVNSSTTAALPATTGSTQSGGGRLRLTTTGASTAVIDFGTAGGSGGWVQATNKSDLATNYPFLINPNGGNVGIGTTSPDAIFHVAKSTSGGVGGQIVIDNPAGSALDNTVEISFLTDAGASGTGTRNARILAVNENVSNGAARLEFHVWSGSVSAERLRISSDGVITQFLSTGAAAFGNGINISTQQGTYTSGHGGILQFQNEDVITAGIRGIRTTGWGSAMLFYVHNESAGNTFGTTFVERMRITETGEIWMGYTTDQGAYLLQVNGSVYATAYYESSDIRLKDVVSTRNSTTFGAIQYTWKDGRDDKMHWGYSAQEVMKWIPDAIQENKDGYYTLDYNQAHTYKIAMLEDRVAELEQELKQLKNK